MAAGKNTHKPIFNGIEGFPTIKQDHLALRRCIFIGAMLADRDAYRSGRPGMGVEDYHRIDDEKEREDYRKIVKEMANILRTPATQLKKLTDFWKKFNINDDISSKEHLEEIQKCLKGHYRIILFNYHSKSQLCTLVNAYGDVSAKNIFLITDGKKWDVARKTSGIFEGEYFCRDCLKTTHIITRHRCEYMCTSCNASKAAGNCGGTLNKTCEDCHFIFQNEKCFQRHKHEPARGRGSKCDVEKFCEKCRRIYQTHRGPHDCNDINVYCQLCHQHVPNQHECTWAPVSDRKRTQLIASQKEWRFGFYDIETSQCDENEDGTFAYRRHYCTTIVLIKVCHLCHDKPVADYCIKCHTREVIFNYTLEDQDVYKVVKDFCNHLLTDRTIPGRDLYAHNGGRFDTHLVIEGMLLLGVFPSTILNKGTTVIKAEFKMRGQKNIILKDSYCIIPMALGNLNSAFDLKCEEKGIFPHLANSRQNWGKKWPSLPDRKYYGYANKTPADQKKFDLWYEAELLKGEWDQDKCLVEYCRADVVILMHGCLKYNKIMTELTGWSPFITANTVAGFAQFVLRANYLNHKDFPYLPEAGYGALNQSDLAIRYFKWLEHSHPERSYEHAYSSYGEKVVRVHGKAYSVDCMEDDKKIIEVYGCYYHGCLSCYLPGQILSGGERAGDLHKRTMAREGHLRTKYEVEGKWECRLRAEIAGDPIMKKFFKDTKIYTRLRPRDALYGGRVEVFRPYLKASADMEIKYYDIVSMYPYVQASMEFPLGHPTVIVKDFLPVVDGKLPYRGLIMLRIVAPRNLALPLLPMNHKECLYFGNCAQCVYEEAEHCTHENEFDRSWIDTYCTVEVEKALGLGYRILEIIEVWTWERFSNNVYKDYIANFMKMKYAASEYPSHVKSYDDKVKYLKEVSEDIGVTLTPEDIFVSAPGRTVAKLGANSGWGKQAENPNHSSTQYLPIAEYDKLRLDASREITSMEPSSLEGVLIVKDRPIKETVRANRYSSVVHAAFVTSYARCLLYDVISAPGAGLAYCDTDSVVFEMARGGVDPLAHLLTGRFGQLSDEVKEGWAITEVAITGCKAYSMCIEKVATGERSYKLASRGVTKDANAVDTLEHDTLVSMVIRKNDPDVPKHLDITRVELKRKMGAITSAPQTKRFKVVSRKRATRGEGAEERKVPFGYIDE